MPWYALVQTSNYYRGYVDGRDPVKPGPLLLWADNPALPADHPEQPCNCDHFRWTVIAVEDDDAIGGVSAPERRELLPIVRCQRRYRRLGRV
jgi:hypothetical protein